MELIKVQNIKPISPLVEFIPENETSDKHFIAANTIPVGIEELSQRHTIPVFAKDNNQLSVIRSLLKLLPLLQTGYLAVNRF